MDILQSVLPMMEQIPGYVFVGIVYGKISLEKALHNYESNQYTTLVKPFEKLYVIYIKL